MAFNQSGDLRVRVIASGSSGNATVVSAPGARILIDCGISLKRLRAGLAPLGLDLIDLDAVVLTHEHSDHVRNLAPLLRKLTTTPVLATRGTARAVKRRLHLDLPAAELDYGQCCAINGLRLTPFATSHDAAEPMGLRVQYGHAVAAIATDLGDASPDVIAALGGADLLIVEANHDEELLRRGPYPPVLKRRVASSSGHLSNVQARDLVAAVQHPGLRAVVLAHLSAENNTPELARQSIAPVLLPSIQLEVASRYEAGPVYSL